jgi:hypothetical protein
MSQDNGTQILNEILSKKAVIRTYKTKWPLSKAIATTYKNNKTELYFNRYKNPREMANMVNTSMHEITHLVGYSHGSNSSIGKEDTVPYKVGAIAQRNYHACN